jgi:hypothetical protein
VLVNSGVRRGGEERRYSRELLGAPVAPEGYLRFDLPADLLYGYAQSLRPRGIHRL